VTAKAVYLPGIGWYRVDPRGNKTGINAQFNPPQESLAYHLKLPEEADFKAVLAEPLPIVLKALRSQTTWNAMLANPPDIPLDEAQSQGLLRENSPAVQSHYRSNALHWNASWRLCLRNEAAEPQFQDAQAEPGHQIRDTVLVL